MLPDQTSLEQAKAAEMARLHAQILGDIGALRLLVDDAWQLIADVRRRRAAQEQTHAIDHINQPAERDRGTTTPSADSRGRDRQSYIT